MNATEKASYLQEKLDICYPSFDEMNVKVQNISIAPLENSFSDDYLTINYLLLRTERQNKQLVNVVVALYDAKGNILQIDRSLQFELKKRSLPYVGDVRMRLQYPYEQIAKIGIYLQEY